MRYDRDMTACPSCGVEEGVAPGAPCPRCGVQVHPPLELDVPATAPAKASRPRKEAEAEPALELAVDPRALVHERTTDAGLARRSGVPAAPGGAVARRDSLRTGKLSRSSHPPLAVGDMAFDARLLADFGDAPRHWLLTPFYAWRVIRRRRELKGALVGRRGEAARAASEAQDALVAFGERVRGAAEKQSSYAAALDELRRAEDLLRSRDRVLASEQDAQNARIAQVDARLAQLEDTLAQAQADERGAVGELAAAQAALAREEAKLKRAELELRNAQQRESSGEVGK
jgi:hypothetical protein